MVFKKKEHFTYYGPDGQLTADFKYQFHKEVDVIKHIRTIQDTDANMRDQPVRLRRLLFRW